jgi:hypothetical protein
VFFFTAELWVEMKERGCLEIPSEKRDYHHYFGCAILLDE